MLHRCFRIRFYAAERCAASLFPVQMPIPSRFPLVLLIAGMLLLASSGRVCAQDDPADTPLGDVARSLRKKAPASEAVIDNDNFSKVMDEAETHRTAGSSMVFSFDSGSKNFRVSSPDVTCSLSFSAKASVLLSDPIPVDELPRSELAKLDGPATIDGDSLQVAMHNGTSWELREVMIGLTIVRRQESRDAFSYHGPARIVPAAAGGQQAQQSSQKQPDVTLLLRVKGSAAPSATSIFRTSLNFALFPDQEWHWAIVKAKGVPPQTSNATPTARSAQAQAGQSADQLSPELRVPGSQSQTHAPSSAMSSASNLALSNPSSSNPSSNAAAAAH
jgi:hypothetical protein